MISQDTLKNRFEVISNEIEQIVTAAFDNQSHIGDLFLIERNASYKNGQASIGPGVEGFSDRNHHEFISNYIECEFKSSGELEMSQEILAKSERIKIQTEMLIYLKIWEGDAFIKFFYQIVRLVEGKPFDWSFKIIESSRDKNATATRQIIIRKKVRDKIKDSFPAIYKAIKVSYLTQLRNSIAHSRYSIGYNVIRLNNYIKEDPSHQEEMIDIENWNDRFEETLALYNGYNIASNIIYEKYLEIGKKNGRIPIRIIKNGNVEKLIGAKYDKLFEEWLWE